MNKLYELLNTLIGKVNSAVKTAPQALSDAEKAQARENIGAAAAGEGGGSSVQTDWNQTDETAADFLKNKPFGEMPVTVLDGEYVFEHDDGSNCYVFTLGDGVITEGQAVTVVWDGTAYSGDVRSVFSTPLFGNGVVVGEEPNEYPFLLLNAEGNAWLLFDVAAMLEGVTEATTHIVTIETASINRIDAKYIPDTTIPIYFIFDSEMGFRLYFDYEGNQMLSGTELINIVSSHKFVLCDPLGLPHCVHYVENDGIVFSTIGTDGELVKISKAYTAEYVPES